jgi:enterochelin esterase family protein
MACVDGSTKLGGSQYVNSELHGDFESHIIDEVIPLVENKFGARGPHFIAGHSSGGMGALHLASLYPHVFQGIASFGGDMYFELTHKNMIANLINDIQQGKLGISMNQCLAQGITNYPLALSAAYSPRPEYKKWKVDFPFDEQKLTIREDIWERWLSFDPLCWSDERCLKLKGCQSVILSAGDQDNFNLHLGAEALSNKLKDLGVPVIHQRVKGDHSLSVSQAEVGLRALLSGGSRHQGRSSSSKR